MLYEYGLHRNQKLEKNAINNPCRLKNETPSSKFDKRLDLKAKLADMVTGQEQLQNLRGFMKPECQIKMMTSSIAKYSWENDYLYIYQFRRDKDNLCLNLQHLCKVLRFFKVVLKVLGCISSNPRTGWC